VGAVSASVRTTEHSLNVPEHPLYQLLGVRYVVAPQRMTSIPGLRQVFRDATSRIYERPRVLPRLFLPAAAESAGGEPWPDWLEGNPDFAARALVAPTPDRPAPWTAARPADSTLGGIALHPAHLGARGSFAEERLVASSVYQDGGWSLLLDGRPLPTVVADGPFVAAWVPAGEHRLDLLYRAPGLTLGVALAALALAAGSAWLLRPRAEP
jgi:hypothetical protein